MRKLYIEIIDECIDKFRLEEVLTFNFSLLDFSDEVFHNYGRRGQLSTREITLLLSHAQKIVSEFGCESPAVKKLTEYLVDELRDLPSANERLNTILQVIFEDKTPTAVSAITSDDISRFISSLPLKHYWDNSGVIYKKAYNEESFKKLYLYQYWYDERHQRPAEVLCREIAISENATDSDILEPILEEFRHQPFMINAEYFGLEQNDWELYELYGQLYDLLNWGSSNPEGLINYLDSRTQEFTFYNCVFPLVLHGIYYGVAYFDLPANFFEDTHIAAQKLSRILYKGWTYVNHYFPAIIMDAYNSRLISRMTRGNLESADDVVKAVNSKVPFRFCYDRQSGILYYFKFVPGEIEKRLEKFAYAKGLDYNSPTFREKLVALDPAVHSGHLHAIPQNILNQDLIFIFDIYFLPGKEKCLPILESHLGQAAFVLETMKDQREHEISKERNRILDMFAHDAKATQEVLIADLEEGMDSDLAAWQLREQYRKERVMRNYLLGQAGMARNGHSDQQVKEVILPDLFTNVFYKTWRIWLKSRRFRESFERNRHPDLSLSTAASQRELKKFFERYHEQYDQQPDQACLEILRASLKNLSPAAAIKITAPPLLLTEYAFVCAEEILYNLLCNFFKHVAPSPLTGYNECTMEVTATPLAQNVYFRFSFSNSTSIKERFERDLKDLLQYGHEIHGLQIIRFLVEADAGVNPFQLDIRQENYIWHIEIGRECYGCRQNLLVDSGSGRSCGFARDSEKQFRGAV
ncbi:MAG: hypothetical protein ONB16_09495 [candidate division KSB1 bacterium]|nr:hypothetical protein [candidate division KSB1 bacterium]